MKYEAIITGKPKSWNAFINKTHWAYYAYAQEIKRQIMAAFAPLRDKEWPVPCVRVSFYCGYSTKRRSDIDSLCLKAHVDGLVQTGIIIDDNRFIIKEVQIAWETTKADQTRIIVETI